MSRLESAALEDAVRRMTPVTAPPEEKADVQALSRLLVSIAAGRKAPQQPLCELVGPRGSRTVVPEAVFYVLERVAEVLARGDGVTVVPVGKLLTTQQAADLLNISRQYLVRLLEANELPFTRTGKHRRLRIADVLAYKAKRDKARHAALDELADLSEQFGGYDELK